jgi:hypothetical protein
VNIACVVGWLVACLLVSSLNDDSVFTSIIEFLLPPVTRAESQPKVAWTDWVCMSWARNVGGWLRAARDFCCSCASFREAFDSDDVSGGCTVRVVLRTKHEGGCWDEDDCKLHVDAYMHGAQCTAQGSTLGRCTFD